MSRATEAPWYVAQLRPNGLNLATRGLMRQGFELFLPKIVSNPKRTAGQELPWVPLFPGYIFVRFDPARPAWRAINNTRGISRLIAFGTNGPRPVPEGFITDLQMRSNGNGLLVPPQELAPGDRIRLLRGPFADLITTIERISPDRRIWILFDILGRSTRVEVRADDLVLI